jgi:hypothetical protein
MLRKVVFATLILGMASATAMACDCVTRSEAESFANADVVFIGKATGTFTWASREDTIVETSSWLKGNKRERVVISSYLSNCDVSFFSGYTYIVYAKTLNGELVTSICSGTAVIGGQVESKPQVVPVCDNYETFIRTDRSDNGRVSNSFGGVWLVGGLVQATL